MAVYKNERIRLIKLGAAGGGSGIGAGGGTGGGSINLTERSVPERTGIRVSNTT